MTKRKVSGGSRSMERFAQTANLLSVVPTCRRQGRSVIEFFKQAGNSEVREWDIPTISVAPTDHLNSYCALVPETACKEFNRFLDRGVVVGEIDNRHLGFLLMMSLNKHSNSS